MDDCIFCKIIKGQIPCYKVWEDDQVIAFLDINPLKKGHLLLVPKKHENYFFDLDDETLKDLIVKSKPLANALKKAFDPKSGKISMLLMGLAASHAHLHLLPLDKESDLNSNNVYQASREELEDSLQKIKSALN